jgi:hypothetical protein
VAIKPGLSLGGYAAFARYDNNETLLMGDLVVTEAEVPKVTDALQSHGILQTALHKHLLEQSPPIWWTHIHGMGDATQLAQGLEPRWMLRPSARLPRPGAATPVDIDVAGVQRALGRKEHKTAALKYSIRTGPDRRGRTRATGVVAPTTVINFNRSAAARPPSTVTLSACSRVQKSFRRSRRQHQIVGLHNRPDRTTRRSTCISGRSTRCPWRALRPALDATNLQPR